jgi:hypothetical protein
MVYPIVIHIAMLPLCMVELLFATEFCGAQAAPAIADKIKNSAKNFILMMPPVFSSPLSNRGPSRDWRVGR